MKLSEISNLRSRKSTHTDWYQIMILSEILSSVVIQHVHSFRVMANAQGKDWLKICLIEQDLVKSPFSFVKVAIFSWSGDKR